MLAIVPSLAIPVLSPLIGQHYSVVDVLAQGLCFFVVATVFYCLAFLLSTVFSDIWRPSLITVGLIIAAALLALGVWLARDLSAASKMQDCLMSGRTNCNVIEPAR